MPPPIRPRPAPDVLLARIQAEAERARRGRLKIFFGACPGVGKTYAMLAAARLLQEQGGAVLVGVADSLPQARAIRAEALRTSLLVRNLLENAAKYPPPGSRIVITAWQDGERVLVGVADNGPGLPPGQEEALFEADSAAPRRVGPCASGATRRTPPSRPTRCPGRGIS